MISPKKLRNYLSQNDFQLFFDELEASLDDNEELLNELTHYKSIYNRLQKNIRLSILSRSEESLLMNELTHNLTSFIGSYSIAYNGRYSDKAQNLKGNEEFKLIFRGKIRNGTSQPVIGEIEEILKVLLKAETGNIVIEKRVFLDQELFGEISDNITLGACLISYELIKENIWVTLITKNNANIKRINNIDQLLLIVEQFNAAITGERNMENKFILSSEKLSNILIKPIINLLYDCSQLFIVTDNFFSNIPFEALFYENVKPKASYKELPYLINRFKIRYFASIQGWRDSL